MTPEIIPERESVLHILLQGLLEHHCLVPLNLDLPHHHKLLVGVKLLVNLFLQSIHIVHLLDQIYPRLVEKSFQNIIIRM